MEPIKSDHIKRLITLTEITLSGFHCTLNSRTNFFDLTGMFSSNVLFADDRSKQITILIVLREIRQHLDAILRIIVIGIRVLSQKVL